MSKKNLLVLMSIVYFISAICLFEKATSIAIFLFVIYFVFAVLGVVLLVLNKLYKRTNHWKNYIAYEKQFISNVGYRDNINRNFDIVNLGSNPARFGFFYDKVCGQNWATGSQGLPMDFEILKYYHSYVKEGGYVLIPIMPFTSVSQYLSTKPSVWSADYYLKFARIIDHYQAFDLPHGKMLHWRNRFPLFFDIRKMIYILRDVEKDERIYVAEQTMSKLELKQDASNWIKMWVEEFDSKSMDDFMGNKYDEYINEGANILGEIIDFCLYRNLKPILITVPMSEYLANEFSMKYRNKLIYEFVSMANKKNVVFLDYMFDEKFQNPEFFNGSFFLNLKGRKCFTEQVLKDLELI